MNRLPRRPRIKLRYGKKDKLFELFGLLLLLAYWVVVLTGYRLLPPHVPAHFNMEGNIDSYAEKSTVFNLPIVATVLYLLISAFSFVPQYFNYMVEITEENAEKEYRKAVITLRFLKVTIAVCCFIISMSSMYSGHWQQFPGLNLVIGALPCILLLPTLYYLFKK